MVSSEKAQSKEGLGLWNCAKSCRIRFYVLFNRVCCFFEWWFMEIMSLICREIWFARLTKQFVGNFLVWFTAGWIIGFRALLKLGYQHCQERSFSGTKTKCHLVLNEFAFCLWILNETFGDTTYIRIAQKRIPKVPVQEDTTKQIDATRKAHIQLVHHEFPYYVSPTSITLLMEDDKDTSFGIVPFPNKLWYEGWFYQADLLLPKPHYVDLIFTHSQFQHINYCIKIVAVCVQHTPNVCLLTFQCKAAQIKLAA